MTLNLQHYDRASLLAGKLHAVLSRSWAKGRDLYDVIWYLSDRSWPDPNLPLLNAALKQTDWSGPKITSENWRRVLGDTVTTLDWERIRADVLPFLERRHDIDHVNVANLLGLLKP